MATIDVETSELQLVSKTKAKSPVWSYFGFKLVSRCQPVISYSMNARVHTVSDNGLATRVWQRETRFKPAPDGRPEDQSTAICRVCKRSVAAKGKATPTGIPVSGPPPAWNAGIAAFPPYVQWNTA